jgi:hypothetical protein
MPSVCGYLSQGLGRYGGGSGMVHSCAQPGPCSRGTSLVDRESESFDVKPARN